MKQIYKVGHGEDEDGTKLEESKCGCCNWEVTNLYWRADSQEDADREVAEIRKEDGNALCGECMTDMLVEEGTEIIVPS